MIFGARSLNIGHLDFLGQSLGFGRSGASSRTALRLEDPFPEGPSIQHLRTLVPNTIKGMVLKGPVTSNIGYLDPLDLLVHPTVCLY